MTSAGPQDSHPTQGLGRSRARRGRRADPSGGCGFLTCRKLGRESHSQGHHLCCNFCLLTPSEGHPTPQGLQEVHPPKNSLPWGRAAFFLVPVQVGLEHWAVGLKSQDSRRGLGRPGSWSTRADPSRRRPGIQLGTVDRKARTAALPSGIRAERTQFPRPRLRARAGTAAPRVAGLPFWQQPAAAAHLPLSLQRPREVDAAGWSGTAWTRPPSGVRLRPLSVLYG